MKLTPGLPEPLGVSLTSDGINIAVFSGSASHIEVCFFDPDDREIGRVNLTGRTGNVFHGHIQGITAGARYGLRAHGPFDPANGHRFNPSKLLLDPYALQIDRPFSLHPALFDADTDSAPFMPKAVVTAPLPPLPPAPAQVAWGDTTVYELHVRGFTKTLSGVPEPIRGTFAGLAHPAAIAHLTTLGVSTVELLPVAAWIDERHLPPLGLINYWGYNPVGFLAPDPRLAPGGWPEVRAAVGALRQAGIETIIDVVYNHTGESDELGPTICLRGLDNAGYYRLAPGDPAAYVNDAGTGNILALDRAPALRLVMDALRAWRQLGGVAGFRFDLASVLGRRDDGFHADAPLLMAIDQDPELRGLKLIAEPWDCGPGGYQLGAFSARWGEWNDRFRDTVRGFWRGDAVSLGELARRIAGSEDIFHGRRPSCSLNFITAHDGFTLADLVSYEGKHNAANGEDNQDGTTGNLSWNNGVEGPSDDAGITTARQRDQRALLATLLLARGTPMLSMGAETGQTQGGNNNAYAQDNATSWIDWTRADVGLTAFTAQLLAIRRAHPALRCDRFLTGELGAQSPYPDVVWQKADGRALGATDWDTPDGRTIVAILAKADDDGVDRVAIVIHRGADAVDIVLPEPGDDRAWHILADSADDIRQGACSDIVRASKRSVMVLAATRTETPRRIGTDPEALERLSNAAGIEPVWWSLDGKPTRVTPQTQASLLEAMGLACASTGDALASLAHMAERFERRALPHTVVRRIGEQLDISLTQPVSAPPPHTWLHIEDERGEVTRLRAAGLDGRAVTGCDGRRATAYGLDLGDRAVGRYRLWRDDDPAAVCHLTVAPRASYLPPAVADGGRVFGLTTQLYTLRRTSDQGIGDLTTLGDLAEAAGASGAAFIGINPLHMLFTGDRDRASPYYPSDRRYLDPIYLDLAEVPFVAVGSAGPVSTMIDYAAVWAHKSQALEASFARGRSDPAFAAFVAVEGQSLQTFAAFQTLAEAPGTGDWRAWGEDVACPDGPGIAAIAAARTDRVLYHCYLQWLCERQLARAADRAGKAGVGICRDLAVGAAPDGAEAWAMSGLMARGASIGAPPDPLGPQGQVWGLPPYVPHRLVEDGYQTLSDLYRRNMRHAGALRIDHALGLMRQFWVPSGADGASGAYVRFPFADLLGNLALESTRAQCLIVGEDLGLVPDGFRDTAAKENVLSYRVLPFERSGTGFIAPDAYPRAGFACAATHDLPPLDGWWQAVDVVEREALGLYSADEARLALDEREREKAELIAALVAAGLVEAGAAPGILTPELAAAIHAFIARTPAMLAAIQVEDLAGETTAVNLPGTDRERPNWRRRLALPVAEILTAPLAQAIVRAVTAERV